MTNNHTPGWSEQTKQECGALARKVEIARKLEAFDDLLKALEAVEWVNGPEQCPDSYCPWCENMESEGHAADCLRDQAIKKARGE